MLPSQGAGKEGAFKSPIILSSAVKNPKVRNTGLKVANIGCVRYSVQLTYQARSVNLSLGLPCRIKILLTDVCNIPTILG